MNNEEQSPVLLETLLLPEKEVIVDFPGYDSLKFKIAYQTRDALIKLRNKCIKKKMNTRLRIMEEELDDELFLKEYSKAVVKGWSGFKWQYLKDFLLADISNQDPNAEFIYCPENAYTLLKHSIAFDDWLTEMVGSLENFT